MRALFEAASLHSPGSPAEALAMGLLLAIAVFGFWRASGAPFALAGTATSLAGFVFVGHVGIPVMVAVVALVAALAAARRGVRFEVPALPQGREVLLLAAGFLAYEVARLHTEGSFVQASANAYRLVDLERGWGLFLEGRVQGWVLQSETLTRSLNAIYSFYFLAMAVGVLLWLFLADRPNYRLYRNALGISVLLAVPTFALWPVAPPRLLPELGIVDTVVRQGREHVFANQYAAVPSLHVGWMLLAGYVLARSIGGWRGAAVGVVPGAVMQLTVVTTGHHYWVDGLLGGAYALGPALLMAHGRAWLLGARQGALRLGLAAARSSRILGQSRKAGVTLLAMTGLLTYLVVGQIEDPGFTDFWGYLVFQMTATLILLLAGELAFAKQGGLSWQTHLIAIGCGYADTFGTAGDLYAHIDEYDKFTHFAGIAAFTSAAYDVLRALHLRGGRAARSEDRLIAAVAVGLFLGVAWEVYEWVGDVVFDTARIGGLRDTTNDLISDALGAMVAGIVLWWLERTAQPQPQPAGIDHTGGGGAAP